MQQHNYTTLNQFISACHERHITTAIVAWRAEWGPAGDGTRDGEYRQRRECRVLAYSNGAILSCEVPETDRDDIATTLEAGGLSVELRNRNLTAFAAHQHPNG